MTFLRLSLAALLAGICAATNAAESPPGMSDQPCPAPLAVPTAVRAEIEELRSDLGNDGVHPNRKGYAVMRKLLERQLPR